MTQPILLDCTIRDGSYAIDFKFTPADTALVAELLERAGIGYVEIGHGLGLGAGDAGSTGTLRRDVDALTRTRERVDRARIGCFFIPGIGNEEHLRAAVAAGMDFVRLGQDADEIEQAWPYVELARELGLEVFVNFMKTYGVPEDDIAAASHTAEQLGARGVYVVDSAGGMLPDEVASYVTAIRERCGIDVGFHGHSNLHLAVANSLSALRAGAHFIDTSVYGIGRSSGNVPTEVMAAVLDRLGIPSGVDVLAVMDIAESYLKPLMTHLQQHDMLAVALGHGRFHSSFLPKALAAAEASGVNPFELIVELGRRDPMRLPDALLQSVVAELSGRSIPSEPRDDLAAFSDPRFAPKRIGNRPEAVAELIEGLQVVAAKRGLKVVLDLVITPALAEEDATASFVMEDDFMALGRLRAGSVEALTEVLECHASAIGAVLLDLQAQEHIAAETVAAIAQAAGLPPILYRSTDLELEQLARAALGKVAAGEAAEIALVDGGWYPRTDVDALAERLAVAVPARVRKPGEETGADLIVQLGPTGEEQPPSDASVICIAADEWRPEQEGVLAIRRADTYRNILPRLCSLPSPPLSLKARSEA